MTGARAVVGEFDRRGLAEARSLPPSWLEYLYYVSVFYSVMGPAVGISLGGLGILMLVGIAGICALRLGPGMAVIALPVVVPVLCGFSFLAVQLLVHNATLDTPYVREFVPWIIGIVILQYLALRRGFIHRAAASILLVGLSTLPFMKSFAFDESRAGLDKTITIANPNDLGAWFGFCAVYLAVLGLETRRQWVRVLAWAAMVGCLLVIGLTVSRAPLLAVVCSVTFALRRVLKRGFVPLLVLAFAGWTTVALGVFDTSAAMYARRGTEETGRFLVWPLAIDRFLDSPLAGVGTKNVNTYVPRADIAIAPHNGLIFIGLAAGVLPLTLFIVYWLQLFISAFRSAPGFFGAAPGSALRGMAALDGDAPFRQALLVYSFLIVLNLNEAFMAPWAMIACASVTAEAFLLTTLRRAHVPANRGDEHTVGLVQRRRPAV
jgi:hypothetical protein